MKITAEMLHAAADKLTTMTDYPQEAEVEQFIADSDWPNYPQMDEGSLAMGICIGIIVATDNNDNKE